MDPETILAAIEQQRVSDAEPREDQERVSYLGFYLGAEVYGLPLEQLREVARVSHLRRVTISSSAIAMCATGPPNAIRLKRMNKRASSE